MSTERKRFKTIISVLIMTLIIPAIIIFGMLQWDGRKYYIISMAIIVMSFIPFALIYESRKPQARELVLVAVMAALAIAGRVAFYMVPQFKPSLAIIIIAGISLGRDAGFICGALSAFVSNMFFGQGPWTPWQMFAFGIIGFLAGIFFNEKSAKKHETALISIFGGISAFVIYGLIMDTSSVFTLGSSPTIGVFLAMYASGLVFNAIHAAATVIFLILLGKPMLKKLRRIKIKYGMLED